MRVYINDLASFMPNQAVTNDEIENVLGKINGFPSKAKRVVLKNNGIKERYYAVDPQTGDLTHSNAQMCAEAVRKLKPYKDFSLDHIECLCCGTTTPDVLFPGHGIMVQGELGLPPVEAATTAGICISGMLALKYAYMNVACGISKNAVAVASEIASSFTRADFFTPKENADYDIDKKPILGFDSDFLRWMLSDGAGAAYLSNQKNDDRISLQVDWIDYLAYAGELDTCMYAGAVKHDSGAVSGWRDKEKLGGSRPEHVMAIKQDIRLLGNNIIKTFERALSASIEKHDLKTGEIDWFLPHYSSAYFRDKFYGGMKNIGFEIDYDRWYTNLPTMGNTGSAAIFIILAELMHHNRLEKGQRLLCFIPESGRFAHCFMHLTVV